MTKTNITLALLIFLAGIGVAFHIQSDREKERALTEKYQKSENDLQRQLEQTTRGLERLEISRNAYRRTVDSLILIVANSNTKLKEKDREIAVIRGKYNHIKADSLAVIMNKRADKWKN